MPVPTHHTRLGSSAVLAALVQRAKRGKRQALFPSMTLPQYEQVISRAAADLGLEPLRLTPHMARHGGPSEDALSRVRSLPEIQARGRWEHPKSVARYRKAGTLLRQIRLMTNPQLRKAKAASPTLESLICTALRDF